MSARLLKRPIQLQSGLDLKIDDNRVLTVKGGKGTIMLNIHPEVQVDISNGSLMVTPISTKAKSFAATTRVLINNAIHGVTKGYEEKLLIMGVGYRASVGGNKINFTLGFSHGVEFQVPPGVSVQAPSQTELLLTGADKQKVRQTADNICKLRGRNPYQDKGIRSSRKVVRLKEVKKKK